MLDLIDNSKSYRVIIPLLCIKEDGLIYSNCSKAHLLKPHSFTTTQKNPHSPNFKPVNSDQFLDCSRSLGSSASALVRLHPTICAFNITALKAEVSLSENQ